LLKEPRSLSLLLHSLVYSNPCESMTSQSQTLETYSGRTAVKSGCRTQHRRHCYASCPSHRAPRRRASVRVRTAVREECQLGRYTGEGPHGELQVRGGCGWAHQRGVALQKVVDGDLVESQRVVRSLNLATQKHWLAEKPPSPLDCTHTVGFVVQHALP
jgi:hypothetical protein